MPRRLDSPGPRRQLLRAIERLAEVAIFGTLSETYRTSRQQPVLTGVLHQPPARLHQPLLQAGQRPAVDSLRQRQPPPPGSPDLPSRELQTGRCCSTSQHPELDRERNCSPPKSRGAVADDCVRKCLRFIVVSPLHLARG